MLDPILVDLREWLRVAEELRLDRNRLSSGVRELLWRYYPQLLELTDDGTAAPPPPVSGPWAVDPTKMPQQAMRARLHIYSKALGRNCPVARNKAAWFVNTSARARATSSCEARRL